MAYTATSSLKKILKLQKRLRIIQGGARAGKTIAILMILIDMAQTRRKEVISIVGESVPFLKRGPIRDFLNIMKEQGYYVEARWNKTDFIYTFETGSIIEFFSADSSDKVRGPARNHLFVNECNNIPYETYRQLALRTSGVIFLDFNPVTEFWVHTELILAREHDFIVLTYKDNEALPPAIKEELESQKDNKAWWKVYGMGLIGEAEGRIYTDWQVIDEIPHEAELKGYGLDFGYSVDPAAIVAVYYYNGGYILDEVVYRKGMFNKDIADVLNNLPYGLVVADSAEPKSIDEIKSYGVQIIPADKTSTKNKPYLRTSIDYVQSQKISVTKRSLNLLKEYRSYLWETDREGNSINEPSGGMDHALDAVRYKLYSLRSKRDEQIVTSYGGNSPRALW